MSWIRLSRLPYGMLACDGNGHEWQTMKVIVMCTSNPSRIYFMANLFFTNCFCFVDSRLVNKQRRRREPPGAGWIHGAAHSGAERGRHGGWRPTPGWRHCQYEWRRPVDASVLCLPVWSSSCGEYIILSWVVDLLFGKTLSPEILKLLLIAWSRDQGFALHVAAIRWIWRKFEW